MKILLTNDDGIYAEGIYLLYEQLKKIGEVIVVAPDSERSAVGHGITLSRPIWYKNVKRKQKAFGYGISGTPADCVKFAIGVLLKVKPDVVVSGINLGPNDGCSVFYSGTVAGAREGALLGIPSIAISLDTFINPDYTFAAKFGAKITKHVYKNTLPKGTFLNVNVPNIKSLKIRGIKATRQCTVPIHGSFRKKKDPNLKDYYWMTGKVPTQKNNDKIDTYALGNNYVTITPIKSDSTDYDYLKEVESLRL
ncbi:MAG: 5'/3'-nucleotidase SurE [Candidatus Omnitrophica bacterium]|nr:5'/3'-nucleotidase SurE [Candidatus Omnitrophota bacterium]MBU1996284.1 5'/3'-nucleotidase SurE [Candidatus Omnitrophota bacterium]MBU4333714.1 5'/3'-nucleotidase SurE [Candidatus Omnitrophota bacterium]